MRIRFFLTCVSMTLVGAGFGIQACGGSSESGPAADAAPEAAAETGPRDSSTAPDVFDARPPCDPNKDILKDVPDASIADGSSTTGLCLQCATTKCSAEIKDCQKDCSRSTTDLGCQDFAGKMLECYAQTQNFFACASKLGIGLSTPQPTRNIGIALGGCVGDQCKDECGVDEPDSGVDSGM
jgi:hypothetical protein